MYDGSELWPREISGDLLAWGSGERGLPAYGASPTSLYASLAASAARCPEATAIVEDDAAEWTYGQLLRRVDSFAAYLSEVAQVRSGDRVALLLGASSDFVVALYAANRIGAVAVPLPTKYRHCEIGRLIEVACPAVIVAETEWAAWCGAGSWRFTPLVLAVDPAAGLVLGQERLVPQLPPGARPTERNAGGRPGGIGSLDAVLLFTSGTTALAKGALLTNAALAHAITTYARILRVTDADVMLLPVPIYHITGMAAVTGLALHVGATLVLHRRFDAERVLRTIVDRSVTFLHASPTVFAKLLECKADFPGLPSWRLAVCGAAHMPVGRVDELLEWLPGLDFRSVYGLTETSSPATVMPPGPVAGWARGSCGRPIPGLKVRVVDSGGRERADGLVGHVELTGSVLLRAYDAGAGGAAAAWSDDGWLRTGDMGYLRNGYLWIVDRAKDMINRGGEKVWCIDVEEALRFLAGVEDAAVVGIEDAVYGEAVAAMIVPVASAALGGGEAWTDERIHKSLRERLASHQVPSVLVRVAALPLTPNLKVDKRAVRRLVHEAMASTEA
ncbi:MAG: acyl--CoA ligase [Bifidobacteriaceae bacterium]|jgi:fatty-acyl-CoA synthase/long-chain acyl-CoA synthetase|nr:acyl--CoA ligase [Bifidobacteriaceae bacterium]